MATLRINPERIAAQMPPIDPVPASQMPYVRTEPRATLRPVNPATGAYADAAQAAPAPTAQAAPRAAPATVQPPGALRSAYDYAVGKPPVGPQPKPSALRTTKEFLGGGTNAAPLAGAVTAGIEEAPKVAASLRSPNATGIDNATQIAESTAKVAARGAGVGIGAKLGGAAGAGLGALTGPFAPVAVPALGFVGAAAGGWAGDRLADAGVDAAISGGRKALGVSYTAPSTAPAAKPGLTPEQQRSRDIINNPTQRGVFTPAQQAQARAETAALRTPANTATDVTRVGNSYSGPANIKGDITVNGKAPGGGFSVMDMSAARDYNNRVVQQALAERTAQSSAPSLRAGWDAYEQLQKSGALNKIDGESRADYATRVGAITKAMGLDMEDLGNQRNNQTSLRNNDTTNATQRRGQDMDLTGKILPKQMEMEMAARMRQLNANIWKESGGNPRRAAELAQSMGMDGKNFVELAEAKRKLTDADRAASDKQFEHRAVTTDDKGNLVINNAIAATSRNIREQLAPGYDSLTPEEQAEKRPYLDAGMNVVEGMNSLRKDGVLKYLGIDEAPTLSTLPDLRGARQEEVGLFEGMFTPSVERGDRKVTLRDGTVRYIPQENFNENERALLRNLK